MAIVAYRVEVQPNLSKLASAVNESLEEEQPLGAPFQTTTGEWAQAMVTAVEE